jgi:hypothetical protein
VHLLHQPRSRYLGTAEFIRAETVIGALVLPTRMSIPQQKHRYLVISRLKDICSVLSFAPLLVKISINFKVAPHREFNSTGKNVKSTIECWFKSRLSIT